MNPQQQQNSSDPKESLEKYARNLTQAAEEGKLDPVIGRDNEIRRIVQVLSRRTKNNPLLLGEPGIGKTAIIEGLASRIIRGDVPTTLKECEVYSLDMASLIAGASHRGEFEERLKEVMSVVQKSDGSIILFIDEIHLLIGAGASGDAMDAANILKPALARGELRCIGATTSDEYRKYIEKDPAFERRFQPILVKEPTVDETISILRGIKERYENHHGVRIRDSSLVVAAQLAKRYITQRFLPDSAIDLIDEAAALTRVQLDSQPIVIDELERKLLQLEVEEMALKNEQEQEGNMEDDTSVKTQSLRDTNDNNTPTNDEEKLQMINNKNRLISVREEIARIKEELYPLKLQYENERGKVTELADLKNKLEDVMNKLQKAEREKDLQRVADLKYYVIPEMQEKIKKLEKESAAKKKRGGNDDATVPLVSEIVGPEQIAQVVSRWTGIQVQRLSQTDRQRLLDLDSRLRASVVGQDEAVQAVSDAILRARAGLARPNQPQGSFLFIGPSGVGKSQLAKALALELFDDEKSMIRLDMSEYMESHSVARLIGAPPGYVGFDNGGQLTEAVRKHPYSVLLLDEVEKAHQNVWNIFLQVLDDGRLTDSKGRTVDFTNTIIIMTSNLGAKYLLDAIDQKTGTFKKDHEVVKEQVMKTVRQYFKPEFLNRLDDIILFTPLSASLIDSIVKLQLKDILKRLSDRHITVKLDKSVIQYITNRVYNPMYGARVFRKWLEKHIVTAISKNIISGVVGNNMTIYASITPEALLDITPVDPDGYDDLEEEVVQFTYSFNPTDDAGPKSPHLKELSFDKTLSGAHDQNIMVDSDDSYYASPAISQVNSDTDYDDVDNMD